MLSIKNFVNSYYSINSKDYNSHRNACPGPAIDNTVKGASILLL